MGGRPAWIESARWGAACYPLKSEVGLISTLILPASTAEMEPTHSPSRACPWRTGETSSSVVGGEPWRR